MSHAAALFVEKAQRTLKLLADKLGAAALLRQVAGEDALFLKQQSQVVKLLGTLSHHGVGHVTFRRTLTFGALYLVPTSLQATQIVHGEYAAQLSCALGNL